MSIFSAFFIAAVAMVAFAANSLLCRAALSHTAIDAASFTTIRLVSGALTLSALLYVRHRPYGVQGSWKAACALFVYAAGFSYAYVGLSAATGALLLFAAVQVTMVGYGLLRSERLSRIQWLGFLGAMAGLVGLLWPGLSAPPLISAVLMLGAGVAWGVYSLMGRQSVDPLRSTAGNFVRSMPMALVLTMVTVNNASIDAPGIVYAMLSGAIASGLGYALWYAALPYLAATQAATLQLTVPVLAAFGGVILLGEPMTMRLVLACTVILGGVALATRRRPRG